MRTENTKRTHTRMYVKMLQRKSKWKAFGETKQKSVGLEGAVPITHTYQIQPTHNLPLSPLNNCNILQSSVGCFTGYTNSVPYTVHFSVQNVTLLSIAIGKSILACPKISKMPTSSNTHKQTSFFAYNTNRTLSGKCSPNNSIVPHTNNIIETVLYTSLSDAKIYRHLLLKRVSILSRKFGFSPRRIHEYAEIQVKEVSNGFYIQILTYWILRQREREKQGEFNKGTGERGERLPCSMHSIQYSSASPNAKIAAPFSITAKLKL